MSESVEMLIEVHFQTLIGLGAPPRPPPGVAVQPLHPLTPAQGEALGFRRERKSEPLVFIALRAARSMRRRVAERS